jgi:hypothetical protein
VTKVADVTLYKANMAENTEEISPTREQLVERWTVEKRSSEHHPETSFYLDYL